MENTLENKAKFFAHYYGQKVLNYKLKELCVLNFAFMLDDDVSENFLELTPLSLITDEDAIEIAKFLKFNWDDPKIARAFILQLFCIASNADLKEEVIIRQMLFDFSDISSVIDIIRAKGYAYKWAGLSEDDLISYGWIKLKTD